jgi:hypothetical protein
MTTFEEALPFVYYEADKDITKCLNEIAEHLRDEEVLISDSVRFYAGMPLVLVFRVSESHYSSSGSLLHILLTAYARSIM